MVPIPTRWGPWSLEVDEPRGDEDSAPAWEHPTGSNVVEGTLARLVASQVEIITACVRRRHGRRVSMFGVVARGPEMPESVLAAFVEFDDDAALLELISVHRSGSPRKASARWV